MRTFLLAPGALLAVLLLLAPAAAGACTCTNEPTLEQEFASATRVFSGRVLGITPSADENFLEVLFEPLERWKGPLDHGIVVVTGSHDGLCGSRFNVGGDYLVFCRVISYGITLTPMPFTTSCSRTGPLAGNPWISQLPLPVLPVPAAGRTWGSLKVVYR